jgi:CRP/FNR family transcriptional regulator, cyclic AMP receptor protein
MYQSINQNVSKFVQFHEEELQIFNQILKYKKASKKTFLLQQGEVCNFEVYILSGCIKSYCIDKKGAEVIMTFAIEDWWVSDIASFNDQKPSHMFIETVEDCELLLLSPQTKEELLMKAPRFERVFRMMVQKHLSTYQERLFGNIAQSAQDRYLAFLEKYPTLPQRVPQHMIASYLGISAEFLSKIRKKLSKK